MLLQIIAIVLSSGFYGSDAGRILVVVPTPSISHQMPFRPLTQELAKRGHEVTVLTTDPAYPKGKTPANLTEIDLQEPSYATKQLSYAETVKGSANDIFGQMKVFFQLIRKVFKVQLENSEVKRLIGNEKFDLVIVEACVRPAYVLSHIFKAPMILLSTVGTFDMLNEMVGSPMHPLLYPTIFHQKHYNLNIQEKYEELYKHYYLEKEIKEQEVDDDAMLRTVFGKNVPSIKEFKKNLDLLFVNVHPLWENNRPVPPNVVYIGGIHTSGAKKDLPKDIKNYLDASKHGVIYMSLGTNVVPSMLPNETTQIFCNVFSKLPYDVLMKWDKTHLDGCSENVKIFDWLPQIDLLRHEKVKLFITQGGLQSSHESIEAGVPLIGLPMASDQWYNVEKYERHHIGVRLDLETLTEDKLMNAVVKIIGDDNYRKNVARLHAVMADQPQSPLERAVWWTEHVLRHGGAAHLRAPAANLAWSEYLQLDLILILLSILLITVTTIISSFVYLKRINVFKVNYS